MTDIDDAVAPGNPGPDPGVFLKGRRPYGRSGRTWGAPTPIFVPKESTPLEDAGECEIPHYALWSMKYLRHAHLFGHADAEVRQTFGVGDGAVHVIDDGRKGFLMRRLLGTDPDGVQYCLVAEISVVSYEQLVNRRPPQDVLSDAHRFAICSVYDAVEAVSNVAVVERYDTFGDVPAMYLPPHPPIEFEGQADT